MKLLTETKNTGEMSVLQEETSSGKKALYIQGPFIQTEIVNRNTRLYPKSVVAPEVARYIRECIDTDSAIGELNHPEHPMLNPERACIKTVSLVEDKGNPNTFIGKAKILQSLPLGQIVAGLITENVRIGVSTRALGSVKRGADGVAVVQSDFRLITAADVVLDPSAPDAYVTALMESKDWVYQDGVIVESQIDAAKDHINKTYQAGTATDPVKAAALFEQILQTILKPGV